MKRKIIIDTDPGIDDAVALMLALSSPELEILAITTVCGNSTIDNTTRNARYILESMGQSSVPVYSGAAQPLTRELRPAFIHGDSGLAGINPTNPSNLTGDAPLQILSLIRANPGEITLVALGPLTNIAKAIQTDPATMKQLKEIICMGGAIEVPGNMNGVAEFNIFIDPEAADIVMKLEVAKTLVPLDVCNQVTLQIADLADITNASRRQLLETMFHPYIANVKLDTGIAGAIMYDPLTVYYLLRPDTCQVTNVSIRIDTGDEQSRGKTIVDHDTGTSVSVVTSANTEAFKSLLFDLID